MNDYSWEAVSVATTSSADDCPTRTTTISNMLDAFRGREESGPSRNTPANIIENQPIEGRSFMIRTRQEPRRFLTLVGGELKLLPNPIPGGGAFWHCHKKDNWYGFRNTVSSTFLGNKKEGIIVATQKHHKNQEYFVTDRHVGGGYIMLTMGPKGPLQVSISADGATLVEQKDGGATWDFIDLKYVRCSVSLAYPGMAVEKLR